MILFPAIDLKDGKCVRLIQGDFKQSTTYNESPLEQAKIFEDSGVEYLHCVDLDGALKGNFENIKSIEQIKKNNLSLGVFGKPVSDNYIVKDNDRVELYEPALMDAREFRISKIKKSS